MDSGGLETSSVINTTCWIFLSDFSPQKWSFGKWWKVWGQKSCFESLFSSPINRRNITTLYHLRLIESAKKKSAEVVAQPAVKHVDDTYEIRQKVTRYRFSRLGQKKRHWSFFASSVQPPISSSNMSATWRNTRQLLIAWPLLRVGAPGGGAVADDDGIHHAMLPPLGTMNGYGSALSSTRLPPASRDGRARVSPTCPNR